MAKKQPRFQIFRGGPEGREFYARFVSKNGSEVWRTSYERKAGATKAIRNLLDISPDSIDIEDLTK